MVARTFRKKKQQQSRVFFNVIFDVYTHVDNRETELELVSENKREEFCRKKNMKIQSGCETMRNASGQQDKNERQWKIKANINTGDKILGKNSSIKIMCNSEVWRLVLQNSVVFVQNNGKADEKRAARANFVVLLIRKKSVLHVQFVFLLIRSIDAISIGLPV